MSNNIALVSLDFAAEQEACVASARELKPMDTQAGELTIKAHLTEVCTRLDRVAGIARALPFTPSVLITRARGSSPDRRRGNPDGNAAGQTKVRMG
jgi:hypothetical protein